MPTVSLISLGCPKNLVDSERVLGNFAHKGWVISQEPEDADLVIVNTCGFIDEAKQEAIDTLFEAAELKETSSVRAVVGIGCLIERYGEELAGQMPEIDAWAGIVDPDKLETLCRDALLAETVPPVLKEKRDAREADTDRLRLTPRFYAYVRIAEGCNNRCNYCVIPAIRGPYVSKPRGVVLREVRELTANGASEIEIIAQDTTLYGSDLYGQMALPELLESICEVPEVHWARLMYTHPAHFTDELIEVLATNPKMCHYIDLPIQHINSEILEQMGRKVTRQDVEDLIGRLRRAVPDIAIRTSLIVGFPGETDAHFQELLDFIREQRFERLGAFAYSREEDTVAYDYSGQITDEEKAHRLDAVMMLQQEISLEANEARIGQEVEVLVEAAEEDGESIGRTQYDAPEIDGKIFLPRQHREPGSYCVVEITGVRGHYDLTGEIIDT